MYMEIRDLREYILNEYEKLRGNIDEKSYIEMDSIVQFKIPQDNYPSGTYVYSDKNGYHIDYVGDMGGVVKRMILTSKFEVSLKICSELVSIMAFNYSMDNQQADRDGRRILFEKELEWLKILGDDYYKNGLEKIKKILKENPYSDGLLE